MEDAAKLAKLGNDAEAMDCYLTVLEIDADNATAWYCLGVLYARHQPLDKAVDACEN